MKVLIWVFILFSIIFICLLYCSFEFNQIFNIQINVIKVLIRFYSCSWACMLNFLNFLNRWIRSYFFSTKMLHNNEFNSYINYAHFQEFCNFLQWFIYKSAIWYHLQKCLYLINHWCCYMFSEALLYKTNKKNSYDISINIDFFFVSMFDSIKIEILSIINIFIYFASCSEIFLICRICIILLHIIWS